VRAFFPDEEQAVAHYRRGDLLAALDAIETALAIDDTKNARWIRSNILLSLGRYQDGFVDWAARSGPGLLTPNGQALMLRLPRWQGEPLAGRRIVMLHEQGFGDGIMLLRYVAVLERIGAIVTLDMPPELARLAGQLAPLDRGDAEFCVPLFDVMTILGEHPGTIPRPPYLAPDPAMVAAWRETFGETKRRRIGIAWSTRYGETCRSLAPDVFADLLAADGAELVSLQAHDRDQAQAVGITVPHYSDFADVTAVAALMDMVVSVDTAAVHVAGAIGHRDVHVILNSPPNWRWWCGSPWYPKVRLHQQREPGDWVSAFAHLRDELSRRPRAS
jgi:hypothetical protein